MRLWYFSRCVKIRAAPKLAPVLLSDAFIICPERRVDLNSVFRSGTVGSGRKGSLWLIDIVCSA